MAKEPLKELLEVIVKLGRALDAAKAVQWDRSPVPTSREEGSSRALGGYSNPTADITLDPRRLAVREAVEAAELKIQNTAASLREEIAPLLATVERWQGES